ncbi:MAG: NADPH-dependent reductase [Flavipsychrobacter sp.]|jgi:predicted dinucleotide-binding enzyme|nr:NADPH-dependent reductase [Flavipsychrobacter sp.]
MMQKSLSVNIAVIGSGEMAALYAARFAIAGHEVFIAPDCADKIPQNGYTSIDNLHGCTIEEASEAADIIVIATQPKNVREVSYWLGDVRGKVVIDATANFIAPVGEQINTVGAIKAITGSSNVVKVFYTKGYEKLLKPLLKNDKPHFVLVSENSKAREVAKIISRDLGISGFIDLGSFESIALFDSLANSWRELALKNKPLVDA